MKLFCFPYAGGSAIIYRKWQQLIGNNIQIIPYEMSGKGNRICEPTFDTQEETIDSILDEIQDVIKESHYCLFGHSMGSAIVFLLTQKIIERKLPKPKHIFLSGLKPPHLKDKIPNIHLLPHEDFIALLKKYSGTPKEFFEDQELLDFFIPKLREDFKLAVICQKDTKNIVSLDINITVLFGANEDDLTSDQAKEWGLYTNKKFSAHCITGSHFFINEAPIKVVSIVKETILSTITIAT